jgi:hypothetical protein
MTIAHKIFLGRFILGILGACFFLVGLYIRYQQEQINEITALLHMSLSELTNLKV